MNPEQSSISIINKNNGQVTGESAQALPVKFILGLSWFKYILIGFVVAVIIMFYIVATIRKQVVVVEVSGKSDSFQVFEIK